MNIKNNQSGRKFIINHAIKADKIRCLDKNNTNIGVISLSEGLKLANLDGLDLVLISPGDVPTVKILDLNKFKYELQKKDKEQNKKQRQAIVKTKQVEFRPCTDIHDLQTKANQVSRFLEEGHKVKVVVAFKGRELDHKDLGLEKLDTFLELLSTNVLVESNPSFDGKNITILLASNQAKQLKVQANG